jgi:hypothetical protein
MISQFGRGVDRYHLDDGENFGCLRQVGHRWWRPFVIRAMAPPTIAAGSLSPIPKAMAQTKTADIRGLIRCAVSRAGRASIARSTESTIGAVISVMGNLLKTGKTCVAGLSSTSLLGCRARPCCAAQSCRLIARVPIPGDCLEGARQVATQCAALPLFETGVFAGASQCLRGITLLTCLREADAG